MAAKLEFHTLANRFPLLEGDQFKAFVNHMKVHGYNGSKKIWLLDNKILDGRNTYRACLELGITPIFQEWAGEHDDPWEFVKMMNLHRAHLSLSEWLLLHAAEAIESCVRTNRGAVPAPQKTTKQIAKNLGVAETKVHQAKRVTRNGSIGVQELVKKSQVSMNDADKVSKLPKEVQDAAAEKVRNGHARTLQEAIRGDANEGEEPGASLPTEMDERGRKLPKHLIDVFSTKLWDKYAGHLLSLKNLGHAILRESPYWVDGADTDKQIEKMRQRLVNARPYALCDDCAPKHLGCSTCRGKGWVPGWRYDEMKMSQ